MSYAPTVWAEGVTQLSPANMNKLETGLQAAAAIADAAIAAPAAPGASTVLVFGGGVWTAAKLVDANIDPAAAIAISKFAGFPNVSTSFLRGDGTWSSSLTGDFKAAAGGANEFKVNAATGAISIRNTNWLIFETGGNTLDISPNNGQLGGIRYVGAGTSSTAFSALRSGVANWQVNNDGVMAFVNAGFITIGDTKLYRSAADVLKTDDSFHVTLDFRHLGANLGFFNHATGTQPTVTGSRGANAALASLLTGLASLGLIIDSSS